MIIFSEWLNLKNIAKQAKIDISKYDTKQLAMGYKVELEHGAANPKTDVTHDDPLKTLKIAIAHLDEDPEYYTKLKKVEKD